LLETSYGTETTNIPEERRADMHTRFVMLRDCRIIFQGTAADLANSPDLYIKEYLS